MANIVNMPISVGIVPVNASLLSGKSKRESEEGMTQVIFAKKCKFYFVPR